MSEEKILKTINEYSATTIGQIKNIPEAHLTKIVAGNLRNTIDAHGDITKSGIGSAAKRIANQLLGIVS
jgi:hypothetical protein